MSSLAHHFFTMAGNNAWANLRLLTPEMAALGLSEAELWADLR